MKHTFQRTAAILAITGALFIASCGKDTPTPTPENPEETITAISVDYILLDTNNQPTTDTTSVSFNASGTPTPSAVHLVPGSKYKTLITFYDGDEPLNAEIQEEGTAHKLFFFPSQVNVFSYEYSDADTDGNGIGLSGITTTGQSGNISLNIILRHGLNKNSSSAQGYNNPDYISAGGEDDANVTCNLNVQ